MDRRGIVFLSELRQVLFRRWYLVILGLTLTGGLAFSVMQYIPPEYSVQAETLMLPPATSVPPGSNPYLALGGLDAAADVLSKSLSSDPVRTQLRVEGGSGDFLIAPDKDTPAPLVLLTVTADSVEAAMSTMDLVLERMPANLQKIQLAANVPKDSYITSTLVAKSDHPVIGRKPQLRAIVFAAALGVCLTLLLTAALDALLKRQNRGSHTSRHRSNRNETSKQVKDSDSGESAADTRAGQSRVPETNDGLSNASQTIEEPAAIRSQTVPR